MSDLDNELTKLLEETCASFYWEGADPDSVRENEFPMWRERIIKAFIDDGWTNKTMVPADFLLNLEESYLKGLIRKSNPTEKVMTGQEWYDGFVKECEKEGLEDSGLWLYTAKKAAGIE